MNPSGGKVMALGSACTANSFRLVKIVPTCRRFRFAQSSEPTRWMEEIPNHLTLNPEP